MIRLSNDSTPVMGAWEERRSKPRVRVDCPALVRRRNGTNAKIEEDAIVENASACGLYLHLSHSIEPGSRLLVLFSLACHSSDKANVPRVAVRGVVVRTEPQGEDTVGLGIKIERYRLI